MLIFHSLRFQISKALCLERSSNVGLQEVESCTARRFTGYCSRDDFRKLRVSNSRGWYSEGTSTHRMIFSFQVLYVAVESVNEFQCMYYSILVFSSGISVSPSLLCERWAHRSKPEQFLGKRISSHITYHKCTAIFHRSSCSIHVRVSQLRR